jgi:D-serine deaminase-like pyridoxal phosphate-dependent protein
MLLQVARPSGASIRSQRRYEGPVLDDIPTPALLLDLQRFDRNVERLRARLDRLGVPLRPHMKTAKSVDILQRIGPRAITVSTLKEAEQFAAAGVRDILYACVARASTSRSWWTASRRRRRWRQAKGRPSPR